MRQRTKIEIPNRSDSEFENFDRFVRIVLASPKPPKEMKPRAARQSGKRRLPRP